MLCEKICFHGLDTLTFLPQNYTEATRTSPVDQDLSTSLQLLCFPLQLSSHSIHRKVDGNTFPTDKQLELADTDWTDAEGITKGGTGR